MLFSKPWFYNWTFIKENAKNIAGDVIDIGCGSSKYKDEILKINKVKSYTGLDFIKNPTVDIVADLNGKLPIKNNMFDTAICISVLEHLLEPEAALKEIGRILKPGSYLLFSTPWIFPYHAVPSDYYRFSRQAVEYLLRKSGFEIVYLSSSGGRWRIVSTFLVNWFPSLAKIASYTDVLLGAVDSQEKNEKNLYSDTPSHKIIARKK